jgi:hypothetical protein
MKLLIIILFIIVIIFLLINNKSEHYKNKRLNMQKYYEKLLNKYKDSEITSLEIDKLNEYLQCKLNS